MTVIHPNMADESAKIRARDVCVFYGDKKAIDEVSIDISPNYVTAFIGPSGCGKSTFLRCFNRMNDTISAAKASNDEKPVSLHFLAALLNGDLRSKGGRGNLGDVPLTYRSAREALYAGAGITHMPIYLARAEGNGFQVITRL